MIPGLAAHLLFMCVRHADYLNDGNKLKSLMHGIITAIKEVITVRRCALANTRSHLNTANALQNHLTWWWLWFQGHQENFEVLSFWLSNTYHFLNCLKQYSGDEVKSFSVSFSFTNKDPKNVNADSIEKTCSSLIEYWFIYCLFTVLYYVCSFCILLLFPVL